MKTGLYGWRIERNGPSKPDLELKNRLKNFDSILGESKQKINFKWVPTEYNIYKVQSYLIISWVGRIRV